jgi:phage/plasmid-like protein (TIGR03299 family)|tara:strand:+ start:41 stop:1006 length:966 start_codon:yes stop_codon:yes gene_type:complete
MAHMVETMAYAGQLPWHGLGTRVSENISVDDMLKESGLDWEVQKVPAYAELNGQKIASGHDMLIRTSDNTALDMVSGNWNPVQNAEAFDFFREFVEAGDMEMHTAGSLQDGKRVWCLAKVKDSFTINGNDKVDSYMLLTNPHMYGRAVDIRFTPIRVVCNNTLTLSLGQKSDYQVSMSHKKAFDAEEAKSLLGIAKEKLNQYEQMATFLSAKRWTDETLKQYLAVVFPNTNPNAKMKTFDVKDFDQYASKNAKRALEVMPSQPGAEMGRGSFWQAYNAVTYLTDHELGRSADSRLASAWYGLNKVKKVKALETAIKFAEAA